ncbi:hypothetical protein GMSM_19470 [Geomonas sp. Red276]
MGVQPVGRNGRSGSDPLPGVGWEGVVDTLPDPVAIIDNQSRVIMVNRVLARRLGGDPERFRGALCSELLHGSQYSPNDCPHQLSLADGREHRCERMLERLGGTFLIVNSPILDPQRRMVASLHLLKDITGDVEKEQVYRRREKDLEWHVAARTRELEKLNELLVEEVGRRRAIADALKASEERYRKVVEDQTEVISRYRPDGTYTFVNETFCRFFGKPREELEGRPWMPDAHPEDLPLVLERLSTLSCDNPVVTVENRVHTGSGEVRWMQFVNRGIFDEKGRLVETQGVGRDVTERKLAEEALKVSEERLGLALAASGMGVWEWDRVTGQVHRSRECAELFGGGASDRSLDWFTRTIHPDDLPRVMAGAGRALDERGDYREEYRVIRCDGEIRWMVDHGRARLDGQGRPRSLYGTTQDITDLKRMETSLRNLSRRLVEIDEETRKKLAAEIHDEMGRDLTTLGLHWALMKEMLSDDSRRILGSRLDDATALLKSLTRNLRTMMVNLRPPVLDDYGLTVALTWYAEFFSEKSGLPISVVCADPFPRLTQECETALFRIAQEALTNAAKHAEAGKVTVTLRREKGMLTLSVADDGRGFGLAAPPRKEGGGWGTAIMRERAMTIGGRFCMESSPGKGCSVTVELKEDACR